MDGMTLGVFVVDRPRRAMLTAAETKRAARRTGRNQLADHDAALTVRLCGLSNVKRCVISGMQFGQNFAARLSGRVSVAQ